MSTVEATEQDSSILTGMDAPSARPAGNIEPGTPSSQAGTPSPSPAAPFQNPGAPSQNPGAPSSAQARASEPVTKVGELPPPPKTGLCKPNLPHTDSHEPVLPDAQRRWAARPITERLQPLRKARHWIAAHPEAFAKAISKDLARSEADTLISELLPLLEAMRFLERKAHTLLAPRGLGSKGRPLWLAGVQAEVHHDPLGHILVIGPGNFPLFLAGVQVVQALVAGNAVTWKPGVGGEAVARLFTHVLREAGLPRGILHVTDDSVEAAQHALNGKPDKVIFTGSFETGRKILATLADSATPAVMELSGADAVVALPSADLALVAKAVAFGLRLNGAEVCMSPRRLLATRETLNALRPLLQAELAKVPPVPLKPRTADLLTSLLKTSANQGCTFYNPGAPSSAQTRASETVTKVGGVPPRQPEDTTRDERTPNPPHLSFELGATTRPILIDNAHPSTAITRTDLFAPVLSLIESRSTLELPDLVNDNPYALTAAIFGNVDEAQALAAQLRVGTVLINDLIAPTVDPRVPFGGRAHSGFGVTRGAEGLLEMTATRTVLIRRKGMTRQYDPLGNRDAPLFAALIGTLHAGSMSERWRSLKALLNAARAKTR